MIIDYNLDKMYEDLDKINQNKTGKVSKKYIIWDVISKSVNVNY